MPAIKEKEPSFRFYQAHLPHWRAAQALYFITWRVVRGGRQLEPHERTIVAEAIHHSAGAQYDLHAFVVMNDHVHLIIRPFERLRLESIVQARKSYTSHVIQRERGQGESLWQREYFDRIIRDDKELQQKYEYIRRNPFKRWPELDNYPWLWPELS